MNHAQTSSINPIRQEVFVTLPIFIVCAFLAYIACPFYINNDGAQYLSTIDQLLKGNGLRTTTIYYEVQAQFGIPALQTVWPPGLPLLGAFISSFTGISAIKSVALINAIAHGLTTYILYRLIKHLLDGDSLSALVISLAYLFYSPALIYTLQMLSEPVFTLCLVASTMLLQLGIISQSNKDQILKFTLASLLVGISCLFRYLGIAFIAGLFMAALAQLISNRITADSAKKAAALTLPALTIIISLLTHNYLLTGHLTGGPVGPRGWTITEIIQQHWRLIGLFGETWTTTGKLITGTFIVTCTSWVIFRVVLQNCKATKPKHVINTPATLQVAQ